MLTKLNNKLLSQYPLLWNTKLIYVIPAALITHLLFYIAGYLTYVDITNLTNFRLLKDFSTVVFSVLVSITIVILWLVFYLRNNPFKSFYSVSRNYLFSEFLLIAVVFFSVGTFFLTFQQGKFDKIESAVNAKQLADEINTINLSNHFIAYDWNSFSKYRDCDAQRERDREDSLEKANDRNKDAQLSSYTPQLIDDDYDPYRNSSEEHSYLNYCGIEIKPTDKDKNVLNKYQLDAKARRWLTENHTDSVLMLFNKLITICKKYNVNYAFTPDAQVAECFKDASFSVNRIFEGTYSEYSRNRAPYIDLRRLKQTINYIDYVKAGFWGSELLLFWILSSLSAAVMLFTFRLTRLKHWFMGLIGVGLWSIIIVLSIVIFKLQEGIIPFVLLLWVILTVFCVKQILNKSSKLISGMIFNWIFWFAPSVIPFIITQISIISTKNCLTYLPTNARGSACDTTKWIAGHWELLLYSNVAIMLIAIYFAFIPLARKWQSNPEE